MSNVWIALGLVFLFGVVPVAVGKWLRWSDGTPPLRLHRRPNVRLVRDEKDTAA